MADSEVIFAGETHNQSRRTTKVIYHGSIENETPIYSRCGHVEDIKVPMGVMVSRGQQIARFRVGGGQGSFANYHLHFDIRHSYFLRNFPEHWPGWNRNEIIANYLDPKTFLTNKSTCRHG